MPEFQLTDSIITSLNAQEPWPDNVRLFQPYEVEQILLPDNASCLAVQAFLKMCNLPFEVEMRWNAEFMSPSGRVPFIKCGAFVVSELEPIVQFAANKGVTLCGKLSTEEKAEMRAYMSLITNVLVNAELYISWIDDETYNAVTKVRNSSVYPWPLGWLQTRSKRNAVAKRLRALNWGDKTLDQVLADVEQCCNSLSQRLGERDYFFGTTPTPLDALVYGHIRALLSANGPKAALLIKPITTSLLKHVVRVVSVTGMKLTPQEEYLLTQAFQFTRNRLSPEKTASDRNTRIKRSRLCIRNASRENITQIRTPSKDSLTYNREFMFGFKPFACKQIIMTSNKDGVITCKYEDTNKHSTTTFRIEENHSFVIDIIEDILDKVEEVAFDHLNYKYEEKNDFEIVYPHDEKFGNITVKVNEYLDTIEENDITDTTLSVDVAEDLIHVINDDDTDDNNDAINDDIDDNNYTINNDTDCNNYTLNNDTDNNYAMNTDDDNDGIIESYDAINTVKNDNDDSDDVMISNVVDSDGVVTDKHLEDAVLTDVTGSVKDNFDLSDVDSSNYKAMKEPYLTVSNSRSSKSDKTDVLITTPDSKSTLKFPSDEEISVESLIKYLRENNAVYGQHFGTYLEVADID